MMVFFSFLNVPFSPGAGCSHARGALRESQPS